jgi:hypothetical protein
MFKSWLQGSNCHGAGCGSVVEGLACFVPTTTNKQINKPKIWHLILILQTQEPNSFRIIKDYLDVFWDFVSDVLTKKDVQSDKP